MKVNKMYEYSDIGSKLWDVLEKNNENAKLPMNDLRFIPIREKVIKYFSNLTPVKGCDINKYLDKACHDINEWNGSYVEALQITDAEFGYNYETGIWE